MSLLPSKPDTSAPSEADPRVIGVDSDDADDVISALSSETARKLLAELHEEPAPPSELADRVDTSLQNAQYHLEKLEDAGAVSVVDTAYSAKGREMDVYAPADQPLVIFAGDEEKSTGLKAALSRLLGGLGVVAVGSIIVQTLYGDAADRSGGAAPAGGGSGDASSAGGNGAAGGAGGNGGAAPADVTTVSGGNERNLDAASTVTDDRMTRVYSDYEPTAGETVNATIDVTTPTEPAGTATPQPETATTTTETVTRTAADAVDQTADRAPEAAKAASIEPGWVFFAGGLVVLALWLSVWYVRTHS